MVQLAKWSAARYSELGYYTRETYSDYWDRSAAKRGSQLAYADDEKQFTWSEANETADALAAAFQDMGLQPNDVVLIQLPNWAEVSIVRMGCFRAGLIAAIAAPNLRRREIEYSLDFLNAQAIVIPDTFRNFDYRAMVREIAPQLKQPLRVIVTRAGDDAKLDERECRLEQLIRQGAGRSRAEARQRQLAPEAIDTIRMTTGSTGFPKFGIYPGMASLYVSKVRNESMNFTENDVFLALLPQNSGLSLPVHYSVPLVGATAYALTQWDPEAALQAIERQRATHLGCVPTQIVQMLQVMERTNYDMQSVKVIYTGGAVLKPHLIKRAEEAFGCKLVNAYGSVEASISYAGANDSDYTRLYTVGKPIPGTTVKLLDDDGREVPTGEVGEIMLQGPSVFWGYYNDPVATAETWSEDGWLRIGDLGKFDDEGNLIVVGRKKEMIIRGGQNIYPGEIETLLAQHPKVSEVACIPIPDPELGERVCACVTLNGASELTLDEVREFMKGLGIAAYKIPERIEVLDKFPLVGEQKIDKKELEKMFSTESNSAPV